MNLEEIHKNITFKEGKEITLENLALVLRTCDKDMRSYGGFLWPESGYAEAPDWSSEPCCGNGLHGLLDGKGDYGLLARDWNAKWLVVAVDRSLVVNIDCQKVKYPCGYVVYSGTSREALQTILSNTRIASTTGGAAHSSTTGRYAHSSTTGYAAHSSTTGGDGIACALGFNSRVKSSSGPMIAVWYDGEKRRVSVAYPGENGIKPDTWYALDDEGNFVVVGE